MAKCFNCETKINKRKNHSYSYFGKRKRYCCDSPECREAFDSALDSFGFDDDCNNFDINRELSKIKACGPRGSDMGRRNITTNEKAVVYLQRVLFVDGDYDRGGAYWGQSLLDLWCAASRELDFMVFVRAGNRINAKNKIASQFPKIKFFK